MMAAQLADSLPPASSDRLAVFMRCQAHIPQPTAAQWASVLAPVAAAYRHADGVGATLRALAGRVATALDAARGSLAELIAPAYWCFSYGFLAVCLRDLAEQLGLPPRQLVERLEFSREDVAWLSSPPAPELLVRADARTYHSAHGLTVFLLSLWYDRVQGRDLREGAIAVLNGKVTPWAEAKAYGICHLVMVLLPQEHGLRDRVMQRVHALLMPICSWQLRKKGALVDFDPAYSNTATTLAPVYSPTDRGCSSTIPYDVMADVLLRALAALLQPGVSRRALVKCSGAINRIYQRATVKSGRQVRKRRVALDVRRPGRDGDGMDWCVEEQLLPSCPPPQHADLEAAMVSRRIEEAVAQLPPKARAAARKKLAGRPLDPSEKGCWEMTAKPKLRDALSDLAEDFEG